MIVSLVAVFGLTAIFVVALLLLPWPAGYEDDDGFHYGEEDDGEDH